MVADQECHEKRIDPECAIPGHRAVHPAGEALLAAIENR
jgi:hypothetical protein